MRNLTACAVMAMVFCAATGARAAEKDRNAFKVKQDAGEQAVAFCKKHEALKAKAEDQRIAIGDKAKDVYKACMAKSGAVTDTCLDEARNEVPQLLAALLASCDPVEGGGVKTTRGTKTPADGEVKTPKKKTPKSGPGNDEGFPDGKVKPKGVIFDNTGFKPPLGQKDAANALEPELRTKLGYQAGELITSPGKTVEEKSVVTCRPQYQHDCETARDFLIEKGFDTLPDIYPVPESNKKSYGFFVRLGKGRAQAQQPPVAPPVAPPVIVQVQPTQSPPQPAQPPVTPPRPAEKPDAGPPVQTDAGAPPVVVDAGPQVPEKDELAEFIAENKDWIRKVLEVPTIGLQGSADGTTVHPTGWLRAPTPVIHGPLLQFRLSFSTKWLFADVYAAPIVNFTYSTGVLNAKGWAVPVGIGAYAGGAFYVKPLTWQLHSRMEKESRGYKFGEELNASWIAKAFTPGLFLELEGQSNIPHLDRLPAHPFENQTLLLKAGPALRIDFTSYLSLDLHLGLTGGATYQRVNGYWDRSYPWAPTGWTLFPVNGATAGATLLVHFPRDLNDLPESWRK